MERAMFDLTGKTAVVTGGAGYLLMPACRGFLEQGARVVIGDISQERLDEVCGELKKEFSPDAVLGFVFDAYDRDSADALLKTAVERFGTLDILVIGTTGAAGKNVEEITPEEFDLTNYKNITAPFLLARSAAEYMKDGGSIVMISSMYGIIAPNPSNYLPLGLSPNPVDYGAGKAAMCQLVRYLAAAWGYRNIRVNAVAPGAFPWNSVHRDHPEFIKVLSEKSMLGRIGRREEVGGAAVFLSSDEASFITGQVLSVDGGVTSW